MLGTKKKVLVVEDDNLLRNILSEQLSSNHEIMVADNGEAGLQNIIDFRPDLVILDLLLPKLSGFELLENLRRNPDTEIADTKVLILSNLAGEQDILRAKTLSVADYFIKGSTDINDLVKKIEQELK